MKKVVIICMLLMTAGFSLNAQTIVTSDTSVERAIPKWRIAVQGGGAYRLGRVPSGIDSDMAAYIKKMKLGFNYGADITYFFTEGLGVGVTYSNSHFSNAANITGTYSDGTTASGKMADIIDISFIGPVLTYRGLNQTGRNAFLMSIGFGYLGYQDKATMIEDFTLKGWTLGRLISIGYDFGISDRLSFGPALSLITGTLTKYTMTDELGRTETQNLDKDSYEGLSNVTLTVGLRYNL